MRNLKQYWQSLVTSINKPVNTQADTSPAPAGVEQEISALSSENQTLAANLEAVRQEIAAARTTEANKLAGLERANHALETARQAEVERLAELESRLDEVTSERQQARNQIMALETSLAAASTRLEKTDDQVKQLEFEQLVHEQLQLETQTRLRTQNQRLSWTMMVAGFAVVLATVAGAILIMESHKNAALLGRMGADMQHLITAMDQHIKTADQTMPETPPVTELTSPATSTEAAITESTAKIPAPPPRPEAAQEMVAEALPEAAPEPELEPELVPETVLETEPEAMPEAVPEAEPEAMPEAVPEAVPETVPEAEPAAVLEAVNDAADSAATPADLPAPTVLDDGRQHSQMLSVMPKNSVLTEAGVDWTMGNLPSGRLFRVATPGRGRSPEITDRVVVNYLAVSPDGKVIDDTYSSGQPATLSMSELGPVLQEALLNMEEGAEWEVTVPDQYPHQETPGLESGLYLIELLEIIEGETPDSSRSTE